MAREYAEQARLRDAIDRAIDLLESGRALEALAHLKPLDSGTRPFMGER